MTDLPEAEYLPHHTVSERAAPIHLASWSGNTALAEFAARYATTNQADHERLVDAIAAGQIAAREGI